MWFCANNKTSTNPCDTRETLAHAWISQWNGNVVAAGGECDAAEQQRERKKVVKKLVIHNELRWKNSVASVRSAVGKMSTVFYLNFPGNRMGCDLILFFFICHCVFIVLKPTHKHSMSFMLNSSCNRVGKWRSDWSVDEKCLVFIFFSFRSSWKWHCECGSHARSTNEFCKIAVLWINPTPDSPEMKKIYLNFGFCCVFGYASMRHRQRVQGRIVVRFSRGAHQTGCH